MTEESRAAMMRALDSVKLDADMRAIAESAIQRFASVTAEPSAAQIVAEVQAEQDPTGGGGGMDAPSGMAVAPMIPEPYHPVSLFRLKFAFGSDGSYSGVTMEEPKFLWNEADEDGNPSTSLKTAGVGTIGLNGTIYLNITLSGEDGAKKFASAQVSMSPDGDISVPLYQLDPTKGVVKDYRHAMISLGVGAPGDSAGVKVSTSSYETAGGGNGIGVTFQPTKNGEDDGDSAGLGIEVEENQPTTGDPGGATIKFQRAKNGQAEGDPVSITISNGEKGDKGDKGDPGTNGQDGADGQDGYSPTATVTKSGGVATITITDKNGTTTETISDGAKGDPGEKGDKGDPGEKGDKGDKGDKGEDGYSPTVNDGTLTLTLGSQTKTFSANQQNDVALTVPAKRLISGTNISITVSGNDITISSGGGGGTTSGFSGTRRTLALTRYDISTYQLQAKFFTETWANGLMTASVIDDAWSVIEGGQAVMETV